MREILFRGQKIEDECGEWVEGRIAYLRVNGHVTDCIEYIEDGLVFCSAVIPSTIGQYTGLTDKNGVKICEGDIIHLYGDKDNANTRCIDYNALVIFKDGGFCAIDGTADNYGCRRYNFSNCELNCQVIGNIHDNSKLLV